MTYRDMSDVTRIQYLRSEIVINTGIYASAAQFFSAYIASNQVNDENEDKLLKKAVGQAIELALITERVLDDTGTPTGSGGQPTKQPFSDDPFLDK